MAKKNSALATATDTRSHNASDFGRGATTYKADLNDPNLILVTDPSDPVAGFLFQDRALEAPDAGLVEDMRIRGFASVARVWKDGPNHYIVSGRRRYVAAKALAAEGIEIKFVFQIIKGSKLDLMTEVITENTLRKDPSPIQTAKDVQRFIDFGGTVARAAQMLGNKSEQHVYNLLNLLNLSDEIQAQVHRGELPVSTALSLTSLSREAQNDTLAAVVNAAGETGGKVTAKAVAAVAKARQTGGEVVVAPSKRQLQKLLASEAVKEVFNEDTVRALRWALGQLPANRIKGLTEALRTMNDE